MAYKYVQAGGQLNKYLTYKLNNLTIPDELTNNCRLKPWHFSWGNDTGISGGSVLVINNTTFNNVVFSENAFSSMFRSSLDALNYGEISFNNHDITINYDSDMDSITGNFIGDYCFENDIDLNSITINITDDITTGTAGKVLCSTQAFRSVYVGGKSKLKHLYFNLRPIGATTNRFKAKALSSMDYIENLDLTYLFSGDGTTVIAGSNANLEYIYSPTAIVKNNGQAFTSNSKVKEIFHTELYINDKDSSFGTVGVGSFTGNSSLTALILYGDGQNVLPLYNTSYFNTCYHILGTYNATYNPDTLHDGYIYVPDALVNSYKSASNWSNFASQIKGLSEYPADGHFYTQVQALINGTLLN